METKKPYQFTTSTLLGATSFVAFVWVLLPLACDVCIEIVCLAALFLCVVTSLADQVSRLKINYVRRSLSVLLAIAAIGLIVQVLRGKCSLHPSALLAMTIFIAFLRPAMIQFGNYRIAWSTMGCVTLTAIIALRYYQTSSHHYFINRELTHGYESESFERDGVVSYTLYSIHRSRRRSPMEIETLIDALDVEACYRPVTKCRMLCGSDNIFFLSLAYATTTRDWMKLRSQSQLEAIEFNTLRISSEEIQSLDSLTGLRELDFFACELPSNFLASCRNAKSLSTLQIVDCNARDLVGISTLQWLRKLSLQKTKLSHAELSEISRLRFLTDLDLRDTDLTSEDFASFASQLKANFVQRRSPFRCVATYDPEVAKGLAALLRSGAISELVLANFASSDEDLQFLRSVDPNVAITVLPIDESGTK